MSLKNIMRLKKADEIPPMQDLPELTLYLLSFVAHIENYHVLDVYDEICKRKQENVSPVSAVLVFLISYLHMYLKDERNRQAFRHPSSTPKNS